MEKLLAQYYEIDRREREIKEEKEKLRAHILTQLQKKGYDTLQTDHGTFSVVRRTRYTYSDEVKKLEEKVKIAKTKEEQKGVAKGEEKQTLMFTPVKE